MLEKMNKKELIEHIKKLEEENAKLKEKICEKYEENKNVKIGLKKFNGVQNSQENEMYNNNETYNNVETLKESKKISNTEKIKIFMNVFKGRTDIYAKRWTSNKTGKSGYSPVCINEFNTYKCDKSRMKCNECPNRILDSLTEEIILKHLQGKITIGIYPLLPGDLCNFLAIDFDKKTYEKDVTAFWNTCDELNVDFLFKIYKI